ncbi:hypothetical protein SAMN05444372_108181 [Flavobacterium micromati]|uniref:Alpha/beta hydrolase n=1 Tax=Flavobacterium micromati TaxID=229205 RepID=A0A1M5LSD3_9FLAO|nr:hypothetical protein [Flavobacterium micromati]SHG67905.1 hypothetical protein SAMN05444372_108181 [Flavobacterium micromati]
METKFYYLHGLHGSKASKKFLKLVEEYPNIECLEWGINDNIEQKLIEWEQIVFSNTFTFSCVIASSTGANFAVQLRNKNKSKFFFLVLINPLLDFNYLSNKSLIPSQLKSYLVQYGHIRESLILISEKDNVINNIDFIKNNEYVKNNNQIIIDYESSHTFENLASYYKNINVLVNSIYL